MRRSAQLLSKDDTEAMLKASCYGTLACAGDDGYPYAVPVNYVYFNGAIYFHCATSGHKTDAILASPKVSFSVVAASDVVREKLTTAYASAVAFGRAEILGEGKEKLNALTELALKYGVPGLERGAEADALVLKECSGSTERVTVVRITIEHLTAKAGREYIRTHKS